MTIIFWKSMLHCPFCVKTKLSYRTDTTMTKLHLKQYMDAALRKCANYILKSISNIAFYLKISADLAIRRNSVRPDGKTTLYKNINYVNQIISYFDALKKITSLIEINGQTNINDIHSNIMSHISG